jgi:hypothetical protein
MSKITTLSGLIGTNGDLTVDTNTLYVDSTNNKVGIGNTSPNTKLDIIGSSTNGSGVVDTLRLRNTGTSINDGPRLQFTAGSSTSGAAIGSQGKALNSADLLFYAGGNSERMRIDSSGNVGIGTSSLQNSSGFSTLSINGTTGGQIAFQTGGTSESFIYSDATNFYFYNSNAGDLRFYTSGTERMRLETDGDLHVDGNVVAYSTTISDIRLKKDIAPIEDAVTKVQQLNGCTFTYLKDDRKSAGLIAQDVEKVLPSAVIEDKPVFHGEEGETYKTVQYDQVIGLLVEAVKELKAEIEELKNGSSN